MKRLPSNQSENDDVITTWNGIDVDRIPLTILLTLYEKCFCSACQIYHDQEEILTFVTSPQKKSKTVVRELCDQLNELEVRQILMWQHANGMRAELEKRGIEFGLFGATTHDYQARDNNRH